VTAEAPITKRCDGYHPTLKKQEKLTLVNFISDNHILYSKTQRTLSDPLVNCSHPIQYKTQNITTDNTSRDCRNLCPTTPERSNQIGFHAFPYLLCRDRSLRGNLLMSPL
jgi:hypothetical protein